MFANGAIRVVALQPQLGEDRARQVASLSGVVLVLIVSRLFVLYAHEARSVAALVGRRGLARWHPSIRVRVRALRVWPELGEALGRLQHHARALVVAHPGERRLGSVVLGRGQRQAARASRVGHAGSQSLTAASNDKFVCRLSLRQSGLFHDHASATCSSRVKCVSPPVCCVDRLRTTSVRRTLRLEYPCNRRRERWPRAWQSSRWRRGRN
jgi:hypothetical protein